MREFLGVILGILLITGMGTFVDGTVDSRTGHGIAGTASGTVCMDDNILYLDDTCAAEYIDGSGDDIDFYITAQNRVSFGAATSTFRNSVDMQAAAGDYAKFGGGLYGKIGHGVDDSLQFCTVPIDGYQNNNLIITTNTNCNADHNNSSVSADPTLLIYSNTAVSGDDTQWGKLTHDQSKFVIDSGTGPVHVDRTDSGNMTTLTASGTLDSSARFVYVSASSAAIVATLPTCDAVGYMFRVKRTDGTTWGVTVNSPDGIDGGTDKALSQYDSYLFHCDTTNDQYWIN